MAVAALGIVLLIVVLWGFFGKITTTVSQNGLLTMSNPVEMIAAPAAGQVIDFSVQLGTVVSAGQVIAHISTAGAAKPTEVVSPVDGRVLSLRANVGSPVSAASPLLSVEAFSGSQQGLETVAYFPLADVQQLRPGMNVEISPSTVQHEQYGYLMGSVERIATVAATRDEMAAALGSASLVDSLVGNLPAGTPLFEVRIALSKNGDHYQWSASSGPAAALVSGTPCSITIITKEERPVSRVLSLQQS